MICLIVFSCFVRSAKQNGHVKALLTARAFHGMAAAFSGQAQSGFALLTAAEHVVFTFAEPVFQQAEARTQTLAKPKIFLVFDSSFGDVAGKEAKQRPKEQYARCKIKDGIYIGKAAKKETEDGKTDTKEK